MSDKVMEAWGPDVPEVTMLFDRQPSYLIEFWVSVTKLEEIDISDCPLTLLRKPETLKLVSKRGSIYKSEGN